MDNHPIPQDVTGFQFRLIGDMTIKQFAYLAVGTVLAWICLSLPVFFLFKLPLVALFGVLGVVLAFVPLGGRSADTMILYFFKAVFSPTQYTYSASPLAGGATSVSGPGEKPTEKPSKKEETVQLQNVAPTSFDELFGKKEPPKQEETQQPITPAPPAPAAEETEQIQLSKEAVALGQALQQAKQEETVVQQGTEKAEEAHKKTEELETELQSVLAQKQALEAQLLELQKQLTQKPTQVFAPITAQQPTATTNVRKIPPSLTKSVGAPFVGDVPNLISGIVKDSRGNVLPNILIEVKDRDGNPVRAFKTSPLGQFASATPVINGVYTVTFEDPNGKHRFDAVELTANGTVLEPLEVISIDAREELRKELFG